MNNMKEYFEEISPVNQTKVSKDINEKIKNAVREKMGVNDESEGKNMNVKVKRRALKTALIAAAVVVMSAVSVVGANAATDGAIFDKVKMLINVNGEDVEREGTVKTDGNMTTIEFDVDEDKDRSVSIEFENADLEDLEASLSGDDKLGYKEYETNAEVNE